MKIISQSASTFKTKSRSSGNQEKSWPPQKMEGTGPCAIETRVHPGLPPLGQDRVPRVGAPAPTASEGFGPQMRRW
eukprot:9405680-Pyramimonas_sp.AAC.1